MRYSLDEGLWSVEVERLRFERLCLSEQKSSPGMGYSLEEGQHLHTSGGYGEEGLWSDKVEQLRLNDLVCLSKHLH